MIYIWGIFHTQIAHQIGIKKQILEIILPNFLIHHSESRWLGTPKFGGEKYIDPFQVV